MVNYADVDRVRLELEAMLREYPELADDEVLRADMLDGATDYKDILVALASMNSATKALGEGLEHYIVDLRWRADRYEARQVFLRDLIFRVMESAQLKKIELPHATLSLRNNPQRLVGEADPATLPDDLVKITRALNRTKIREAIEAGQIVPGFSLSNAAPSLVVKVK
jgi:hypothetical protein